MKNNTRGLRDIISELRSYTNDVIMRASNGYDEFGKSTVGIRIDQNECPIITEDGTVWLIYAKLDNNISSVKDYANNYLHCKKILDISDTVTLGAQAMVDNTILNVDLNKYYIKSYEYNTKEDYILLRCVRNIKNLK